MNTSNKGSGTLHSGAFNFSSFIQSGVDPRTGSYSCNLALNEVLGNRLCGPTVPLALVFSAFNSRNSGLGTGWSLPLSSYNRTNHKLSLSSGTCYHVHTHGTTVSLLDKKLDTVKVHVHEDTWVIEHKNGTVEELTRPSEDDDEWLPSRIFSPEGRYISFFYSIVQGQRVLRELRDQHQSLLRLEYESDNNWDSQPGLTLWPDSQPQRRKFHFVIRDNWLRQISLTTPHGREAAHWVFDYQTSESAALLMTHVQTPAGAVETLSYNLHGHALPSGAPVETVPVVTSWRIAPGAGQPAVVRQYEFSRHNYFGYGAGYVWSDNEDYLYQNASDYVYTSTETVVAGAQSTRIERCYNRFHLMISQVTTVGTKVQRKLIDYHDAEGRSFNEQPAIFQLQKSLSVSYYDLRSPQDVRTEITRTTYDSSGNLLETQNPTGGREINTYYAAAGEAGCPANPGGFVHFLKSKSVIPSPDFRAAPTTRILHTYADLPSLQGGSKRFLVLLSDELYEVGTADPLVRTTYRYVSDPTQLQYGKVSAKTDTMGGASTTFTFTYTQDQDCVRVSQGVEADAHSCIQQVWYNELSGQEVKVCDHDRSVLESTYDGLGRLKCETVASPTHPASRQYAYHLPTDAEGEAHQTLLNSRGAQHITTVDGLGRKVHVAVQDLDPGGAEKPMREVYRAVYTEAGQLSEEFTTDWFEGVAQTVRTAFRYDEWGNVSQITGPAGTVTHEAHDPVTRTHTRWLEGAGKTVTVNNVFGKPASVERIDTQGRSLGQTRFTYDGLGRCVETLSPPGLINQFSYDVFGRLIQSVLPEGTVITRLYSPRSIGPYPTQIKANDYVLGTRTYDALMRISSTTVGGRTERFTYERGRAEPSSKTCASGKIIHFTLDPLCKGEVARRSVEGDSDLTTTFNRASPHGQLLQASNPYSQENLSYFASGKLESKEYVIGDKRFESSYTYSLMGKPISFTDITGSTRHSRYDPFGRLSEVEQGPVKSVYGYDARGALKTLSVNDTQAGRRLVTELVQDDFAREIRRTFILEHNRRLVLEQAFTVQDKLQRRTLSEGPAVLRDETYEYDLRGRLKRYTCSGPQAPVDPMGNVIVSQDYTYDYLDNIRSLTTCFEGDEDVTTFSYDYIDRTQLSQLTHSHPDYTFMNRRFEYDADGHQLTDEWGRVLTYDALGGLCSVGVDQLPESSKLVEYSYSPMDKLQSIQPGQGLIKECFYHEGSLANEVQGEQTCSYFHQGSHAMAQMSADDCALLGTDSQGSVLHVLSHRGDAHLAYTPYGNRPLDDGMSSLLGFNGELPDPVTGCYLLGNGYRAYNPILMRFHSPDSLSVFDGGGFNAYAYCLGDPINFSDPTGHITTAQGVKLGITIALLLASLALTLYTFGAASSSLVLSLKSIISVIYEVVSTSISIASAVLDELAPDTTVAKVFSYASLALGGVSGANWVIGKAFNKGIGVALTQTIDRVGKAATHTTWSGTIATSAVRPMANTSTVVRGNGGLKHLNKLHKQLIAVSHAKTVVDYARYSFTGFKAAHKHYGNISEFVTSHEAPRTLGQLGTWVTDAGAHFSGDNPSGSDKTLPLVAFFEDLEDRADTIRHAL